MPIVLILVLALVGCSSDLRVVTQTPASVTYACEGFGGCTVTPQQAADAAQRHCKVYGKNAQQSYLVAAPSGDMRATFVCVQ